MQVSGETFRVEWNGHDTIFRSMFSPLLTSNLLTDITLATRGGSIRCHKLVLAACSPYLQELLVNNASDVTILLLHEMEYSHIKSIVHFLYNGEMHIPVEEIDNITKICTSLGIRGFSSELKPIEPGPLTKRPDHIKPSPSESSPMHQLCGYDSFERNKVRHNSEHDDTSGSETRTPDEDMATPTFPTRPTTAFVEQNAYCPSTSFLGDLKEDFGHGFGMDGPKSRPRTELKRYRQYTANDITCAVDAIRNGMAIARASQNYGVPSRTLYDKVKKMGIPTRRYPKSRCGSNTVLDDEDTNDIDGLRRSVTPKNNNVLNRLRTSKSEDLHSNRDECHMPLTNPGLFQIPREWTDWRAWNRNPTRHAPKDDSTEETKEAPVNTECVGVQGMQDIDLKVEYYGTALSRRESESESHAPEAIPIDLSPNVLIKQKLDGMITNS